MVKLVASDLEEAREKLQTTGEWEDWFIQSDPTFTEEEA